MAASPFLAMIRYDFCHSNARPVPTDGLYFLGKACTYLFHRGYGEIYYMNSRNVYVSAPSDPYIVAVFKILAIATLPITVVGFVFLRFSKAYQSTLSCFLLSSNVFSQALKDQSSPRHLVNLISHALHWQKPQQLQHCLRYRPELNNPAFRQTYLAALYTQIFGSNTQAPVTLSAQNQEFLSFLSNSDLTYLMSLAQNRSDVIKVLFNSISETAQAHLFSLITSAIELAPLDANNANANFIKDVIRQHGWGKFINIITQLPTTTMQALHATMTEPEFNELKMLLSASITATNVNPAPPVGYLENFLALDGLDDMPS